MRPFRRVGFTFFAIRRRNFRDEDPFLSEIHKAILIFFSGEQLEMHEIVKARLLSALQDDDLARACLFLMTLDDARFEALLTDPVAPALINIGCGTDLSIAELATITARVVGFSGSLCFDSSKPDGTPRKLLDIQRIQALGWQPAVALAEGIAQAYQDFLNRAV